MKIEIQNPRAPSPLGTYSQGICSGQWVFLAGQIGLDLKTHKAPIDFMDEAELAFQHVRTLCEGLKTDLSAVVKLTLYLTDLGLMPELNALMKTLFHPPYPARTTIQVAGLPKGTRIEIDAILIAP